MLVQGAAPGHLRQSLSFGGFLGYRREVTIRALSAEVRREQGRLCVNSTSGFSETRRPGMNEGLNTGTPDTATGRQILQRAELLVRKVSGRDRRGGVGANRGADGRRKSPVPVDPRGGSLQRSVPSSSDGCIVMMVTRPLGGRQTGVGGLAGSVQRCDSCRTTCCSANSRRPAPLIGLRSSRCRDAPSTYAVFNTSDGYLLPAVFWNHDPDGDIRKILIYHIGVGTPKRRRSGGKMLASNAGPRASACGP